MREIELTSKNTARIADLSFRKSFGDSFAMVLNDDMRSKVIAGLQKIIESRMSETMTAKATEIIAVLRDGSMLQIQRTVDWSQTPPRVTGGDATAVLAILSALIANRDLEMFQEVAQQFIASGILVRVKLEQQSAHRMKVIVSCFDESAEALFLR
jgi:hypothetical protein